mgnify:CR=1 FL=1
MSLQQPLPPAGQNGKTQTANDLVNHNPGFVTRNPDLAAAGIASGNTDTFNTLAISSHMSDSAQAFDKHQQTYNSTGWWNTILKDVKDIPAAIGNGLNNIPVAGKAVSTVLGWASKPLQEIQKDYKFIHSLYADHGVGAGLLGTLGVLAGGVIGTVAGPAGTALGAELGAAATRNILGRVIPNYQDSFKNSNDPNYQVSFGRDLANIVGDIPGLRAVKNTNTGFGQIVSGIADAAFDFEGDPLASTGKFYTKMRRGDYIAATTDAESKVTSIHSTLPIGSSMPGVKAFFEANSSVVHTPEQIDAAMASPLQAGLRNAVKDIASIKNPVEIGLRYGYNLGWSRNFMDSLAKAEKPEEVVQVMKQALYSANLADEATAPLADLRLPSRTLGKMLSDKIGANAIRNSAQTSTINEERNLLLPKRTAVTEPVYDENGNQTFNQIGQPETRIKTQQVTRPNGEIANETVWKLTKPAILSPNAGDWLNAISAKVRTFTGRRALSYDSLDKKLSSTQYQLDDPNLGQTLYDVASYAMPHKVALEWAAHILTANEGDMLSRIHVMHQEVLKARGLADSQAAKILGQAKDALGASDINQGVYGYDNLGNELGAMDLKPEYGGGQANMGVVDGHAYQGAMLDLKAIKNAFRDSKAYGSLYNKTDDFFTKYTNVIFAPLALLSPAFGLRVAAGEAMHQVMRRGLPNYLSAVLANTLVRLDSRYHNEHLDAVAQSQPKTNLDAIEKEQATGKEQIITNNEITDALAEKENMAKRIWQASGSKQAWNDAVATGAKVKNAALLPFGWVANQYLKSNLIPYTVKQYVEHMSGLRERLGLDGGVTPGISGGHGNKADLHHDEVFDMYAKTRGHGSRPSENLAALTELDPHYHYYLAKNISMGAKTEAIRDIAKDYLAMDKTPAWKNLSEDEKFAQLAVMHSERIANPEMYTKSRQIMRAYDRADPEQFANTQTKWLRGIVQGNDGTINKVALNRISSNLPMTSDELEKMPLNSLPIKVLGVRHMPTISDGLRRAENAGFRTFVTPIIDYVSRQPLFGNFYVRRRIVNQNLVDKGLLSEEEADKLSANQATREMIPAIHSPQIRSQFAVLHRNLFPFYFAQEQAMRRVGRLIRTNPAAFRDFQMIQQGMNNPGFVHTDANNQKYVVYPLLGEFGNSIVRGMNALGVKQFTGLPESITGSTSSLLTVLPEVKVPSVGPFANIAITELAHKFPWLDKASGIATGGYPSSNWMDTIIPNSTVRDIFNGMIMDDRENTVYNSKLSAIAAAYYHGDLPDNFTSLPPEQQATVMDKIENNAKSNLFIKGLMAFFLPLAPNVSNDYYNKDLQTLRSEYLKLLSTTNPSTGKNYTLAEATDKFISEHGDHAVSYTVSHTKSGVGGAYLPLADSTLSWIKNNQSILNNPAYANAAPFLIPQVGQGSDALQVEKKLLTMHYRARQTPADFMNSLYIQKGWQDLGDAYKQYQTDMQQARTSGNRIVMYQITQAWKTVSDQYGQSNPIWYADYNNPTRIDYAQNAVKQFQTMKDKGLLSASPQGQAISDIMDSYKQYHQDLLATVVNGRNTPQHSMVQDMWYTYLQNLETANPQLTSVINSVFRRVK